MKSRKDRKILEAVVAAFETAEREGDNWVDHLPDYIESEDRYKNDNWYIGTLPDGRTIWLTAEHLTGVDRYTIQEAEEEPIEEQGAFEEGIRPYGLGKFDSLIDSWVYVMSLDGGADEEAGSVADFGVWYGKMSFGGAKERMDVVKSLNEIAREQDDAALNRAEADLVKESAGVILSEDNQGFVNVEYIPTEKALESKWFAIEGEFEEEEEPEENEEQVG